MWIYVYFVFVCGGGGVTSSSSSSTSLVHMSSADCSISLLLTRREVRDVFTVTGLSSQSQDNLNNLRWKSYTVSWRTSGWKWAGHETSVEKQKDASLHPPAAGRNYVLHLIYRADYLTRLFWCEPDLSKLWGHVPSLSHQRTTYYLSCSAQGHKLAYKISITKILATFPKFMTVLYTVMSA